MNPSLMRILCRALLCCMLVWHFPAVSHCLAAEDTPPLKTVRAAVMPYLDFATYFIAQEEGFFADQGLKVEFVQFKVSSHALPALINGDLDVVAGRPFAAHFNAMAKGVRLRFVADRSHLDPKTCSSNVIMARAELVRSGLLDRPETWTGLKVAISNASSPGLLIYERLLHKMGLTLETPRLVFMPGPIRMEAMIAGTIDMATFNEPQISLLLETGKALIWKEEAQVYPEFQHAVLAYGPTLLDRDHDAGKRFMTAYLQGVRQLAQGKTERNLEILHKHTGLDAQVLLRACWPSIRTDGSIDTASVLDMQNWLKRQTLIERVLSPGEFWDSRFVDHASRVLEDH